MFDENKKVTVTFKVTVTLLSFCKIRTPNLMDIELFLLTYTLVFKSKSSEFRLQSFLGITLLIS